MRRYIRSGRLHAEKRNGRFGPEYFVSDDDLSSAGLEPIGSDSGIQRSSSPSPAVRAPATDLERVLRDSVPLNLFQELQMKHEQLLVQYGMVRAGGLRVIELQAEVEAKRRQLDEARAEIGRLKQRFVAETETLRKKLREAELEQEGQRLQIAALREKVRGLEMLTRNAVTTETIERKYSEVMEQARHVDRLTGLQATTPGASPWTGDVPQDH